MRRVLSSRRVVVTLAALAGAGAALGVAACGGGDQVPSTITTDLGGPVTQVSTPSTTSASSTPSTPSTPTGATTSTPGATTATGAGGATTAASQPTRVPAVFTLKGGKLTPSTVSVPAFLEAEVSVSSTDGRAHTVKVQVGKGYTFTVPPKGSGTTKVPGQKAGNYQVLVDGKSAGTLTWGGEPGP